jgi:hypothetical protein
MPELVMVELDDTYLEVVSGGSIPLQSILSAADQVVDRAAPTADPTFDRVVRFLEALGRRRARPTRVSWVVALWRHREASSSQPAGRRRLRGYTRLTIGGTHVETCVAFQTAPVRTGSGTDIPGRLSRLRRPARIAYLRKRILRSRALSPKRRSFITSQVPARERLNARPLQMLAG